MKTLELESNSNVDGIRDDNLDPVLDGLATIRLDREPTELSDNADSSDEYDTDIEPSDEIKRKLIN